MIGAPMFALGAGGVTGGAMFAAGLGGAGRAAGTLAAGLGGAARAAGTLEAELGGVGPGMGALTAALDTAGAGGATARSPAAVFIIGDIGADAQSSPRSTLPSAISSTAP
jgi:hypothetical protein